MYSFHILLERQLKRNIPCLKVKLKLIVEAKQIKTQNKAKQNKLKTKTNKMREVMSIHIGQAGCQMGNACWELCEF